jgi:hypothetical protein
VANRIAACCSNGRVILNALQNRLQLSGERFVPMAKEGAESVERIRLRGMESLAKHDHVVQKFRAALLIGRKIILELFPRFAAKQLGKLAEIS